MSQAATSFRIGSKVRISRVRDRIPAKLVELLKKSDVGKVINYKMTDGKGIGVIVELSDGTVSWFFDDEISPA
ncbi:MAG: DUF2862 domain-containing protein [Prochlorococcus sp.]|jgi:hypothetical protein|nr:DUF2862 domain-containing protein [Planctomycetaceae bacterium]MDP6171593.1 DUF2862 domain-containing protein [Prochlorococcaceae cyanobacterium ETNP2_MAG_10]MDP6196787.1 DUF2862 domain-containing protein [Prochlorococcaceae cyanobacterium ETNP18_MAG_17]MDP6322148.1 DUF2862 domain-containing protein [Prochlorococcaceae cyanobacterium ETNP14_MAG_5]HJO78815.1 DUF2862 domain-containing protein [Prochlorococcaceae cyanobacterium Fu_MAG_134]